jgi:uncharacterized membrane protein YgdD (TMEM256/DUF423 family)
MDDSSRTVSGSNWIALGALLGVTAVGLGAFGAHGLEGMLAGAADGAQRLDWWETAAHYHLVHALAVVAAARVSTAAVLCLTAGVLVFSGTLYAMALGAPSLLGAVTPIGGVSLMLGWVLFGIAAWKGRAQ